MQFFATWGGIMMEKMLNVWVPYLNNVYCVVRNMYTVWSISKLSTLNFLAVRGKWIFRVLFLKEKKLKNADIHSVILEIVVKCIKSSSLSYVILQSKISLKRRYSAEEINLIKRCEGNIRRRMEALCSGCAASWDRC